MRLLRLNISTISIKLSLNILINALFGIFPVATIINFGGNDFKIYESRKSLSFVMTTRFWSTAILLIW